MVLEPRVSPEHTSKYMDTVTLFAKTWTKGHWLLDDLWPHIWWALCVTLSKDHCVQVSWEYIKVCGYSDHYCKNLDQTSLTPRWPLTPHLLRSYGGTTLNQLPIGLHVKILNFNGRFEAYWATFGMLSWYQSIQNRWKLTYVSMFG